MAQTATKERPAPQASVVDADHYDGVPGGQKETPLQRYEAFAGEVQQREREIASLLPSNISPERFRNTAIAAVKQNLDLLNCTRRSLMQAITRAAMDGLMPDGREGVITPYKGQAQWNPMAYGLRKRLRELDDIIADVQVVHANDLFKRIQGDVPTIEHEPVQMGQPKGAMIGAYAIFKQEGVILHREVMDAEEIEKTRAQSKAKESLMWTTFASEGYRKSVLRRGIKTVPVSDSMQEIVKRDDEANFDFSERQDIPALVPPPAPPSAPKKAAAASMADIHDGLPGDWSDYLDKATDELASASGASAEHATHEAVADTITGARERGELSESDAERIRENWERRSATVEAGRK